MQSTFVNIKINVPQDKEFREKLTECVDKCFKYDYDLNIEGWYYVDISNWSVNLLSLSRKVPNNWLDIECFVNTYGNEFSGFLSTQDELDILEDYFPFNIYDHWATEVEESLEYLGDNWEQDTTIQEEILEWYKEIFTKEWEEIEKQQEEIRREFIEDNIHEPN